MKANEEDEFVSVGPVLAEGTFEGEKWQFRGSIIGDHCRFGMETSLGGGHLSARLPFDEKGRKKLGYFGTTDLGRAQNPVIFDRPARQIKYVAGVVHPTVATVRVVTQSGETLDAQIFPGDSRVSFFLVLVPHRTKEESLLALDEQGTELERRSLRRL